jgi:RNA polymerase sigma-70 factor (ECF subfamily)
MTPAATAQCDGSPGDPVRMALEDSQVRAQLRTHARDGIAHWPCGRSEAARESLAEEATQETIAPALQLRHTFDHTTGTVAAWMHGILVNVLREMARRRGRQPDALPAEPGEWERLAKDLSADAVAARLDAASYLALLSEDQRTILALRYWDDLSAEEIASQLGISVCNARVRLCRALRAAKAVAGLNSEENGR